MKKIVFLISGVILHNVVFAQAPQKDVGAIKSMTGCYKVSFDYAETFAPDSQYVFKENYHSKADAEWIFVEEETPEKIVLQHILVVNDTVVIKHWRQDWLYQNKDLYAFNKNRHWQFQRLDNKEVRGQWTQKVYQVDDSPRYEGSATWIHVDGRIYWENVTDAPLPRREFTKRSDYNVMQRTNRQMLTDYGWLHEQDNLKILRENGNDKLIAEEKGYNRYYKIDDEHCKAAADWWQDHAAYWSLVRNAWDEVFARNTDLFLEKKSNDQMLWKALFELGDEWAGKVDNSPHEIKQKVSDTINRFVSDGDKASK